MNVLGQAKPDRPLAFHEHGQRAIIDQGAAHRLETSRRMKRLAPREHATAGRCGRRPSRIVHPGEGIEHLEEEHESRREPALSRALAAQLDHQRRQNAVVPARDFNQTSEHMRRVGDVGVGEQDEFRLGRAGLDLGQACAHRRQFAGPTGRRAGPRDDLEPVGGLSRARRGQRGGGCAIRALVVDHHHGEPPRIVLAKERANAHEQSCRPRREPG